MPHAARKVSASGYYHVVPKGSRNQIVFEDDSDRSCYVQLLADAKKLYNIKLHAYCLMSNHIHLAVEDPEHSLSAFLKYVNERYAMYFCDKTDNTGGVFVKHTWSEPIETDAYLLCALRYIHANPTAAGICPASTYEWSSAKDYLGRRSGITDTTTLLNMLGGIHGFIEWSKAAKGTALPFPTSSLRFHLSDDEALRIARAILGEDKRLTATLCAEEQREVIQLLHQRLFSSTQIARIVGISPKRVRTQLGLV